MLFYEEFLAALSVQLVYGKRVWTLSKEKIPHLDNGVDELEVQVLYQTFKIELVDGAIESLEPIKWMSTKFRRLVQAAQH